MQGWGDGVGEDVGVEKIPKNPEPNRKNTDPKPKMSQTDFPKIFDMLSRKNTETSVWESGLSSQYFGIPIPNRNIYIFNYYIYIYIYTDNNIYINHVGTIMKKSCYFIFHPCNINI